jgi:hypothetical protein
MAMPGLVSAAELREIGVRRLSAGGALASAARGLTRKLASSFLAEGRSDALFGEGVDYGAMNASLAR